MSKCLKCPECGLMWDDDPQVNDASHCDCGYRIDSMFPTEPKAWRSIAVWPDTIRVGHIVGKNESDDTHESWEAAQAVCGLLRKHGFGGDGKVFPISTRVEPIYE